MYYITSIDEILKLLDDLNISNDIKIFEEISVEFQEFKKLNGGGGISNKNKTNFELKDCIIRELKVLIEN